MYPFVVTFPAASTTSIAAAQTLGGAGALALSAASGIPSVQRVVTLTSAGNLSAANVTVTGTDTQGNVVAETRAGPNANTVATTAEFATVTSVTSNAALATAMSVGTGATGHTCWFKTDRFANPANITVACAITATASFSVQDTPDNVDVVASPTIFTHPTLVTLAASAESNYAFPPFAIRGAMISSSGAGACTLTIIQAGK